MSTDVEFEIKADAGLAKTAVKTLAKDVKGLRQEVQQANAAMVKSGESWGESMRRNGMELQRMNLQARKAWKGAAAEARTGWGTMMQGALLKSGAFVASQMGATAQAALSAGVEAERAEAELVGATAGGAGRIAAQNRELGARFGVDANYLNAQAANLAAAGLNTEQVMTAIKSNVVATRGDLGQLNSLFESVIESASGGFLKEDLLGKLDKNTIALRQALQEHLGMTKQELTAAMSAGKVTVQDYFAVIEKLTGEGTMAWEMAARAADTAAGQWERVKEVGTQTMAAIGGAFLKWVERPLGVLTEKLTAWGRLFRQADGVQGEYLSYEGGEKEKEAARVAEMAAAAEKVEAKRREGFVERLEKEAGAYRKLAAAAREAREAGERAAETLGERRYRVAASVGLQPGSGVADIDRALAEDAGMAGARRAAGALALQADVKRLIEEGAKWGLTREAKNKDVEGALRANAWDADMQAWHGRLTSVRGRLGMPGGSLDELGRAAWGRVHEQEGGDLARAQALLAARKEMAEVERLIAEEQEKQRKAEEKLAGSRKAALAEAKTRKAIELARIGGDEAKAEFLTDADAAAKRAAELQTAGVGAKAARKLAVAEVARGRVLAEGEKEPRLRSAGWVGSSLAEVGGGGMRHRVMDAPTVTAAKTTAQKTAEVANITRKLLTFLEKNALPAVIK